MKPVALSTERLFLDAPRASDIPLVFRYCQDPDIQRFTTVPRPYRLVHATSFVSEVSSRGWISGREPTWAIRRHGTGILIGVISLRAWQPGEAMIGCWLGAEYRGAGYIPEAASVVCDFAFGDEWRIIGERAAVDRVLWETLLSNRGSARAAWKAGFRYSGQRSSEVSGFGEFEPSLHAELRRSDDRERKDGWPEKIVGV